MTVGFFVLLVTTSFIGFVSLVTIFIDFVLLVTTRLIGFVLFVTSFIGQADLEEDY